MRHCWHQASPRQRPLYMMSVRTAKMLSTLRDCELVSSQWLCCCSVHASEHILTTVLLVVDLPMLAHEAPELLHCCM